MESSETRLSRGTWFPVARYLQRLKQSGAEIAREEAIDVEGHRIVGHFQDVGNGPEYLKMNIALLTLETAYLNLSISVVSDILLCKEAKCTDFNCVTRRCAMFGQITR